ncbi:MAG: 2OG-Fe(II) oxygenase, partial [Brevundimonas sp.]
SLPPDPVDLRRASDDGDAEAAHRLAVLAAVGFRMAQDWDVALEQLARAAALGSGLARDQFAVLAPDAGHLAADGEDVETWMRAARTVDLASWLAPPRPVMISSGPHVLSIPGFLPATACDWLIQRASERVAPAEVYDPATGLGRREGVRTNSACAFDLWSLDLVMVMLRERVIRVTGLPAHGLEPLQVLRYDTGETFDWHVDYLTPDQPGLAEDIARKGQRIATLLVYLNADYEGGETAFESTGLRHRGARGDALMWANTLPDGRIDTRTRHAGLPPTQGVKWVASQWCRSGPPRR